MKKIRMIPPVLIISLLLAAGAPGALALEPPELNGKAAVLADLNSGKVLYALNENDERAPASLTKVMTVLLALEALDSGRISLTDMVTAQDDCRQGMEDDSSTSGIVPGMQVSVKDLLYCALLQSANEGCNILGRYLAGSISGFVEQMNQKAEALGCTHTHFMNTNGLPAENHYSSAYDQYIIFAEAMKYPLFMEISNTTSYLPENSSINAGEPPSTPTAAAISMRARPAARRATPGPRDTVSSPPPGGTTSACWPWPWAVTAPSTPRSRITTTSSTAARSTTGALKTSPTARC